MPGAFIVGWRRVGEKQEQSKNKIEAYRPFLSENAAHAPLRPGRRARRRLSEGLGRVALGEDDGAASARAIAPDRRRPSRVCGNFSWFGAYWRHGRRSSDHRCRRAGSFAQRSLSVDSFPFRPSPGPVGNVFRDQAGSRRRRREGAEATDRRLEGDLTKGSRTPALPARLLRGAAPALGSRPV